MPHFPKPFFKPSRGVWYVQLDGKQINLGRDRDAAFKQYYELMNSPRPHQPLNSSSIITIIDLFLEWVHKNRAPDTYEWYRQRLQQFAERYPDMRVSTLKPFHVEQWIADRKFAKTTRRNYFRSVKTCLRWAVKQGHLEHNPLEALEMPGSDRREVYLSPQEFERILSFARDECFRELLVVTYRTGCRPQESLIVTAEYVDVENARWVFPKSKAKGKQAPRIVYLEDESLRITQRLMLKHPTGPLFRNVNGDPWTTEGINCVFDRIQVRMGREALAEKSIEPSSKEIKEFIKTLKPTTVRRGVKRKKTAAELKEEAKRKLFQRISKRVAPRCSLYALRHSWATNALKRGVDPLTVALLMGHKDPSMLARVYQHLSHSPDHMLERARQAAG